MFNFKKFIIMFCECPLGESLTDVNVSNCPESFGQIQKVIFQRLRGADGKVNQFKAPESDITKKATWTPLLMAADGTKVVVSPYINAPDAQGGAARTFGGGNESLGGIEEIIGRESTPFNGVIRRQPQSVIKALKTFQCDAAGGNLGVYLIDENGNIGAIAKEEESTYEPIPIMSLFIGDKTLGGYEAPDSNAIQWQFKPNWSDNLVIVKPADFNPLTDLVKG